MWQGRVATSARPEDVMSQGPVHVGLDVAKATLDVALRPSEEHWSVSNDEAGIARPGGTPGLADAGPGGGRSDRAKANAGRRRGPRRVWRDGRPFERREPRSGDTTAVDLRHQGSLALCSGGVRIRRLGRTRASRAGPVYAPGRTGDQSKAPRPPFLSSRLGRARTGRQGPSDGGSHLELRSRRTQWRTV